MKVQPFYSTRAGTEVYHNNNECTEGNNIESKYKAYGTEGKRLCYRCKRLNKKKK